MDVEYTRNVIISVAELGTESKDVFERALRSFERRPALISSVFRDFKPVIFRGEERATFSIDLARTDRIMISIAQALHYHDFGRKHKKWRIFAPTFQSEETLNSLPDRWEQLRRRLALLRYQYMKTAQPKVFAYGRAVWKPFGVVYQLIFYDAAIVNALTFR